MNLKFQIKSIYGSLLFEGESPSLLETLLAAIAAKVNLSGANLSGADLSRADLSGANLSRADLYGANLSGAKDSEAAIAATRILPEGDIIGWKKCGNGVIAKLLIPSTARRSHAFGRKCRAEFVQVLGLWNGGQPASLGLSHYDEGKTEYRVGETVRPSSWNENWMDECAAGIHFFITRLEAEAYLF